MSYQTYQDVEVKLKSKEGPWGRASVKSVNYDPARELSSVTVLLHDTCSLTKIGMDDKRLAVRPIADLEFNPLMAKCVIGDLVEVAFDTNLQLPGQWRRAVVTGIYVAPKSRQKKDAEKSKNPSDWRIAQYAVKLMDGDHPEPGKAVQFAPWAVRAIPGVTTVPTEPEVPSSLQQKADTSLLLRLTSPAVSAEDKGILLAADAMYARVKNCGGVLTADVYAMLRAVSAKMIRNGGVGGVHPPVDEALKPHHYLIKRGVEKLATWDGLYWDIDAATYGLQTPEAAEATGYSYSRPCDLEAKGVFGKAA